MSFLDSTGDIIIDSVLTDEGRRRLAKGDGSFEIVKFACSDDEINYALYDKDHVNGSEYFDVAIMQTPILESITNNTSTMHSKLISNPRNDLLYLPVFRTNDTFNTGKTFKTTGMYYVACDKTTEEAFQALYPDTGLQGVLYGENSNLGSNFIRIDQGINSDKINPANPLNPDLYEGSYEVQINSRYGMITSSLTNTNAEENYTDDDAITFYLLNLAPDTEFVKENTNIEVSSSEVIAGPRGTILSFKIKASIDLNTSTTLFTEYGAEETLTEGSTTLEYYYIDSIVRVVGNDTASSLDIPIKFIKLK